MNNINVEIRYKILYNELIKLCGRILNFIFRRIYTKEDYIYFLNMILTLIDIFTNFGFQINLSEFCCLNFNISNEKKKKLNFERVIFYLEALYYYVQLNFLKCTFTLRGGLYNLTDCYIKILKNDLIPKLTPKSNKRLISLKFDKLRKNLIYKNSYFSDFNSPLFFDLKSYIKYLGNNNYIDIIEEYIIKHLKALSLLAKFKIKIHSNIGVQNTFVDINLMFDDHYSENTMYKNIVPYAYFSTSFYLVEIGKITQTVKLLRRMVGFNFDLLLERKLCALTYYNLGLLQYALGYFDIGIHNIETSYKLIVINNLSDKIKFYVIDSLGLAYLNQKNLFKAYLLIQTSIKERKKLNKQKYQIKCNRLNVYLNYIIDLYEYNFISKSRFLIKKKYKNYDKHKILKFVLGEEDKELVISEQNLGQFIKVVEFIWKLSDNVLKQLNLDNPPKAPSSNREEIHHERNFSFNSDVSQTSTFIYKDSANERDELWEEYEEDIEVKTNLYDTLLTRQQQQEFKELKTIYLKRDIILRDSLGFIEKFNINFDPIYADEFQKIIEKLKINFLLKEIFYCFQNEKWRDELYNYNQNNILFGLSKYLKLEKIQNMMAIERSKNIEMTKNEKKEKNENITKIYDYYSSFEEDENSENLTNKNLEDDWLTTNNDKEEDENISNKNMNEYDFNKDLNSISYINKNKNLSYDKFKQKFISSLKEIEKDNKNDDLLAFMNLDEDYLYYLYKNVYQNNPDQNFIFKNPLLVLNYIFLEINNPDSSPIIGSNNNLINSSISKTKEEKSNSFNSLEDSNNSKKVKRKANLVINKKKNNSNSSSLSDSDSDSDSDSSKSESESSSFLNLEKNKKFKKPSIILNPEEKNKKKKERKSHMVTFNPKLTGEKENIKKQDKKRSAVYTNFKTNYNEDLIKKKSNNVNSNNNSDSFDSTVENKDTFKENKDFTIIHQETTYCYIPIKRKPTFVIALTKKEELKENPKISKNTKGIKNKKNIKKKLLRRKSQMEISATKYNILDNSKKKYSMSMVKGKKEKTFIEELDDINFNFSKINNEEEEENRKNFELIQKKNRKNIYRTNSNENSSNANSKIYNLKKKSEKSNKIIRLNKKDILLGNYNKRSNKSSNKKLNENISRREKSSIKKNRPSSNKSIFDLEKELESRIRGSNLSNINPNNINKESSLENTEEITEKIIEEIHENKNRNQDLKFYNDYKNNSLIRNYIQNNIESFSNNKSNNKSFKNNNYTYFLNKSNKKENNINSQKGNKMIKNMKDYSFISNKINKNKQKDYGFKSKAEREKKLENEAIKYLQLELNNQTNLNKNRLINSSGVEFNPYKSVLNQYKKSSQQKINNNKNKKIEKENEIISSYVEEMSNKKREKERKQYEANGLMKQRNSSIKNNYGLYIKEMNTKIFNGIKKKSFIKNDNNYSNLESFTSRINNKVNEESFNNKNLIYENSSFANNINNNSKYISNNNSFIYKKRTNKSIEISNDKKDGINSDTNRLIKKYKLLPFLKKDSLIRSKENSGLATLSNTNVNTPRSKRKNKERKSRSIIENNISTKKLNGKKIQNKK